MALKYDIKKLDDSIKTDVIATDAITTDAITTDAITTDAITTDAITTDAITTDVITTEDFASPDGQQAFIKFWQENKDTEKYTNKESAFNRQLAIKLNAQKYLPEPKLEAELHKELLLADFFRLSDNAKFKPQAKTIVQPKKEHKERKAYQANIEQLKKQLNASINFFARTGSEPSMLTNQEQEQATKVTNELVCHYQAKHNYSFDNPQIIEKIHGEIVEYLVSSIAEDYLNQPQNKLSLEELKKLIKTDAKYRNDDENIGKITQNLALLKQKEINAREARIQHNSGTISRDDCNRIIAEYIAYRNALSDQNDAYDKKKAALRLLTKIPNQREYSTGSSHYSLALEDMAVSIHKHTNLVRYMCIQWVAATDLDMPLNEIVISSAKESNLQTLIKNNAPEEAVDKLQQQSNAEYIAEIIPDIITASKESFVTILGDVCREHSVLRGHINGADVPSCTAGINGRLSRINKYNTITLMENPYLILDKIIRNFILKQYNLLPEIQQIHIGTAMDACLSLVGSFFHDEDMPLTKEVEKAVDDFLLLLEKSKTKEQLNKLIDANLRNLIANSITNNSNTQQIIELCYTISIKRLKDDEQYLNEKFIYQSFISKLTQPAADLLVRLQVDNLFRSANTANELANVNKIIDTALKTFSLEGNIITESTFEKIATKLKANAIYAATPDYCVIPFATTCHDEHHEYNRIKIPADGNCMLSAVINGCIQKRVKLPEGITNIDTLRKRLVQQMRNEYEETCTNMYLFLFNNNLSEHITLNGWQDNPSILDHFRGHQHLPDATREIFRAYKDILGKFLAATVDHDAYYPENQVGGDIYKYFKRISSDGVWCGETELNFISELLNIQITTHSEVNVNLHIAGAHKKYVPNIHLHHTGAHYELLCNKNTYDTKLAIDQVSRKKEILFQQALTQQSQVTRRWWGKSLPPPDAIQELERAHKDGRKEDVETIRSAILEMQEMMPRPIARPRRFGTTINMGYTYTWSPSRT